MSDEEDLTNLWSSELQKVPVEREKNRPGHAPPMLGVRVLPTFSVGEMLKTNQSNRSGNVTSPPISPVSPLFSTGVMQNRDQSDRSGNVTWQTRSLGSSLSPAFMIGIPNLSKLSGNVSPPTSSLVSPAAPSVRRQNTGLYYRPENVSPQTRLLGKPAARKFMMQNPNLSSSCNSLSLLTMDSLLPMPRPICLIENVGGKTLVLNKEAERILQQITQPVVVIAIVGKYRTGKSYLMNKLAGTNTGFPLGSTIQSKTKGIWMWCVPHPWKPGQTLVLLDTEGLGDVEKGDSTNDSWIFSLAVLLSSSLVFNSLGTIDQQAMDQLHYVTELTKMIKLKASAEPKDETGKYSRYFPSFTWCVRDFTLTLEKNGRAITEDQYLMSSLALKTGTDKTIRDYNLPRECILQFFHTHKCFVFDRPASAKKLHTLEQLHETELEMDFVEQAAKFYSYMLSESRVKTLAGGTEVTGRMLAILTDSYIRAIRSGTVPCIENAVLALAEIENTGALQDALSKYQCEMDEYVLYFPTETQQEFLNMHKECEKEAITVFLERSLKDKDQKFQRKLKEEIDNKMNEYSAKNEKTSTDFCTKLIKKLSMTIKSNLFAGKYSISGGHQRYVNDKNNIIETYESTPGKGMKALDVLQEYISDTSDTEAAILLADNTLTQSQKALAESRAHAENMQRDKQIMEQNNRILQQRMDDQERSFEQHKAMLMEKLEEERKKLIQQYELLISQKLKEQGRITNARNQKEMADLQKKIASLDAKKPTKRNCRVM